MTISCIIMTKRFSAEAMCEKQDFTQVQRFIGYDRNLLYLYNRYLIMKRIIHDFIIV